MTRIVRSSRYRVKPMSPEDAVLELEATQQDMLVFRESRSYRADTGALVKLSFSQQAATGTAITLSSGSVRHGSPGWRSPAARRRRRRAPRHTVPLARRAVVSR